MFVYAFHVWQLASITTVVQYRPDQLDQWVKLSYPGVSILDEQKVLANDDSDDSDDSDAAPDDVGFAASKLDVLQKVQAAVKQITGNKEKLKGKRRQRQEEYALQKVL